MFMTCRIFVRVGCTFDAGSPAASDPHVAARQRIGSARALRGSSRSRHCPESPACEATHRLVRCTSALRGNQPPARSAVSTTKPIDSTVIDVECRSIRRRRRFNLSKMQRNDAARTSGRVVATLHRVQTNQQLLAFYFVRVVRGGSAG